jgi:ADP-ribosyl-[dinitrogen reductase] hydrolase
MGMKNHKLAVIGTVLGQAIGDALGHPTEFNKSSFVRDLQRNNTFTDDTQMAMAIAEAILTVRPTDPEDLDVLMQEVARNFVRWDDGDERWGMNDRSPGGCCMRGVRMVRTMGAENWRDTGDPTGKGNGGVMRVSMVGATYWRDPFKAFQVGALTSVPTHNNIESILASGICAAIIAQCIQGKPFALALGNAVGWAGSFDKNLLVPAGNDQFEPEHAIAHIAGAYALAKGGMNHADFNVWNGNDFKGAEALAAAIFWNARCSNFRDVVVGLANYTGDSDSTAAIGGAIAGARWGMGMIPTKWRHRVERSAYLHDLAERLWEFSSVNSTDTSLLTARI